MRYRRRHTINSDRTSCLRTLHDDIRSYDSDFNRKTTACVDDAAKLMACSFSERQFVKRADVEGVAHVEVVVAAIGFEVVRNRRCPCFVRAGSVAEAPRERVLRV